MSRYRFLFITSLLIFVGLSVNLYLTRHVASSVVLGSLNQLNCATGSSNKSLLHIRLYMPAKVQQVSRRLCASPVIAEYYSSVTVSWLPRESMSTVSLLNQDFDVLMGRAHSLNGLLPDFDNLYAPLINIDGFSVSWFSRYPINFAELNARRIGLVNDSLSHTHYLLPLQSLKSHQIAIDTLNITYYSDIYSLYNAFEQGDIDMLSTIDQFANRHPDARYTSVISSNNSTSFFFARHLPHPVTCEIADALTPLIEYMSKLVGLNQAQTEPEGCPHD
ncbi:MAG: hypothetical protein HWE26_04380 [Alteromonadaceae bacterium]|nr:hypothetical protein [Alteromonadaceae bacterium]